MAFVRAIGRWSLTALVINAIIGSSIFGMPSEITRLVGRASPLAMLLAALVISLIVACMAEVASQFTEAGGSYLYVRTAFGRFAGLQVGWFWLLTSMAAGAASANLFVQYLASIWPAAGHSVARIVIITVLIAIPTTVNYFGVRGGTYLSNILTVAKLLPIGPVDCSWTGARQSSAEPLTGHGVYEHCLVCMAERTAAVDLCLRGI